LTIGLIAVHFIHGTPLSFEDPFGFLAQVVLWAFFSIFSIACYFDSSNARLHSGPGCADPAPIDELLTSISVRTLAVTGSISPHDQVTDGTVTSSLFPSIVSVLPTSGSSSSAEADQNSIFGLVPGSVPVSTSGSLAAIGTLESIEAATGSNHGKLISVAADAQAGTPGVESSDKLRSAMGSAELAHGFANSSSVHPVDDPGRIIVIPPMPVVQSFANPVLMQMHRTILFLGESLFFGGIIVICDTIVAISYPSLPRCVQSDPFGSEAGTALRTLFDLFT
jgi:hypothetical protein